MSKDVRKQWLFPIVTVLCLATTIFAVLYTVDHYITGGPPLAQSAGVLARFVGFDPERSADAIASLASMVASVLGIVVTVVSIIVQLSAARFTGVTVMFFRDRTNVLVMSFYVTTCVIGIWLSLSIHERYVPRATVFFMLLMTTGGLALMGPYFSYVFRFLEPKHIIERIGNKAVYLSSKGAGSSDMQLVGSCQAATLSAMEELTDITSNSISCKDKVIASCAVDALRDLAVLYLPAKKSAYSRWYEIGDKISKNPDFVAMDPESLKGLEGSQTWVEWKVLRQYLGIYNEALGGMKDINYLIAINTRYIGEAALSIRDSELISLVLRYMNSYLRATLNSRDVRTAYNILNQYRLLVETMVRTKSGPLAITAVGYMKYYGHISIQMNLAFVAETVAYDISSLCSLAHEVALPEEAEMLRTFLDLDMPASEREKEAGLKGVRKAQVKLAAYYITCGELAKAKQIKEDMDSEPAERLIAIWNELERVSTKDFWEIIDRGNNFEFLPPDQKAAMRTFFEWFNLEFSPPESIR